MRLPSCDPARSANVSVRGRLPRTPRHGWIPVAVAAATAPCASIVNGVSTMPSASVNPEVVRKAAKPARGVVNDVPDKRLFVHRDRLAQRLAIAAAGSEQNV